MNDRVDIWVFFEYSVECFFVRDVDLLEVWPFATDELNAIDHFGRGIVKVVDDYNFVASFK